MLAFLSIACLAFFMNQAPKGSIQLDVRDYWGNPVEEYEVSFNSGAAFSLLRRSDVLRDLPLGHYSLVVRTAGADSSVVKVDLKGGLIRVPVGLPLGRLTKNQWSFLVSGRISASSDTMGEIILKIIAMYGDITRSMFPDNDGRFQLKLPHGGLYIVNAARRGKLCATRVIRVAADTEELSLTCAE